MLTLEVIENEIKTLIEHGTNYEDCARLASLYVCRAGLTGELNPALISSESSPVQDPQKFANNSEFVQAIVNAGDLAWPILDEMADVMRAVNPNLYAGVVRNLREAG